MRKKLVSMVLIALSLFFFIFAEVMASEKSPQSTVPIQEKPYKSYSLGEIVVYAPKAGADAVGTMTRITAVDIENSGARTLDEVLDLIPSNYVRIGGSGTPRIDMRGFRTRHVILLLDGVPFNSTYDGQFDPTIIPVENIAEIKVITGGGSVLYGQGGNGGIINIITKKAAKGVHGSLQTELGSEDSRIGRFSFSGGQDKFDTFISGSMYEKDGFPLSDDFTPTIYENGGQRENSDFERKNVNANFGYSPNSNTNLGLTLSHSEGENGVPPVVNYNKSDPFTKTLKYDRVDDMDGNSAQLAFNHKAQSPFSIKGWLYINQQNITENRYDDPNYNIQIKSGSYSIDSTSQIYGGNIQLSYDFNEFGTTTLAWITESDNWEADGFEINKKGGKDILDTEKGNKVNSLALEYNVSPVNRLNLVSGYGYHTMNKDAEGSENGHSWLFGAVYDLFEKTSLKASYAAKIRFPSISQLYDVKGGNPNLEAERSKHYELGVSQEIYDKTDLALTLFRIDAKDFIEKDAADVYQNFQEYRFSGLEIAFEGRPINNLAFRTFYAYLDSEDKSVNTEVDELQYRPKNKYGFDVTYLFNFGLSLHGDIIRVDGQYFYDSDNKAPLLKKELNDYTTVNVKLTQHLFKNFLEAYIGADNLLDENYEQSYGLPQAGRTFYGGMKYHF